MERRREQRGDFGIEIGPQGFARAADQRDPLRAERDDAARQHADCAGRLGGDFERDRIALRGAPEDARREGAEISRLRLARPTHHRHRIVAEFAKDFAGQRARRREPVISAGRGAQRFEADMGGGAVVAEREAASADDGFAAGDPGDRNRAGAGVHEPPVRAGMRADAGGCRVVRRARDSVARKRRDDPRFVARVAEARKAETDRDPRPIGGCNAGLAQDLIDDAAHDGDRSGEIDVDIRRRAARLGERFSLGVAQTRAAARGAAVDAEIKRRAAHSRRHPLKA